MPYIYAKEIDMKARNMPFLLENENREKNAKIDFFMLAALVHFSYINSILIYEITCCVNNKRAMHSLCMDVVAALLLNLCALFHLIIRFLL